MGVEAVEPEVHELQHDDDHEHGGPPVAQQAAGCAARPGRKAKLLEDDDVVGEDDQDHDHQACDATSLTCHSPRSAPVRGTTHRTRLEKR